LTKAGREVYGGLMRIAWGILWSVSAALVFGASSPAPADSLESPGPLVEIRLSDGTLLRGRIASEDDGYVVVESELLGRLTIERVHVESVVEVEETSLRSAPEASQHRDDPGRRDPDRNTIMLGPTPETLPAGTAYFRNFELFILNFGFAPSDILNLSIGTIFPVTSELRSLSVGIKLRLTSREKHGLGLAVAASGTTLDQEKFGSIIGIIGIGDAEKSLNLSVHRTFTDGEGVTFFIAGGDVLAGNGFKLFAEYGNSTDAVLSDEDFTGLVNVGFRIFGERTSFSLSGFRPLAEDTGSFIAFPVAMYSRHF
jgi:hypothetical protein